MFLFFFFFCVSVEGVARATCRPIELCIVLLLLLQIDHVLQFVLLASSVYPVSQACANGF